MSTNPHGGLEFDNWLTAAFSAFRDQCGYPPAETVIRRWKRSYADGRTPAVAAKIDLYRRPMALIRDGILICPICDTANSIKEEDRTIRQHELIADGKAIFVSRQDNNSEHSRYFCDSCDTTVQLPAPAEWI